MAKIQVVPSLLSEIEKKFKGEAHKILDLMETLEENPNKGKLLGNISGILIKELRYKSFRFYFIVEGDTLRFFDKLSLADLLIRFVRMSDKKSQQKTINEIKKILRKVGSDGFD